MGARLRKNEKFSRNTLLSALLGVLLLAIIGFLINTNLNINRQRTEFLSQIKIVESEIKVLEEKKKQMEEKIFQATSREYLEEAARDRLGWQFSGEEAVVVTEEKENKEKPEEREEKNKLWQWIKNFLNR